MRVIAVKFQQRGWWKNLDKVHCYQVSQLCHQLRQDSLFSQYKAHALNLLNHNSSQDSDRNCPTMRFPIKPPSANLLWTITSCTQHIKNSYSVMLYSHFKSSCFTSILQDLVLRSTSSRSYRCFNIILLEFIINNTKKSHLSNVIPRWVQHCYLF